MNCQYKESSLGVVSCSYYTDLIVMKLGFNAKG